MCSCRIVGVVDVRGEHLLVCLHSPVWDVCRTCYVRRLACRELRVRSDGVLHALRYRRCLRCIPVLILVDLRSQRVVVVILRTQVVLAIALLECLVKIAYREEDFIGNRLIQHAGLGLRVGTPVDVLRLIREDDWHSVAIPSVPRQRRERIRIILAVIGRLVGPELTVGKNLSPLHATIKPQSLNCDLVICAVARLWIDEVLILIHLLPDLERSGLEERVADSTPIIYVVITYPAAVVARTRRSLRREVGLLVEVGSRRQRI